MDDYSLNSLGESKNEWCARLVNALTPTIIQGLKSIFLEAWNLCEENTQKDKYLMTFQTFLSRIPKWNNAIIETERKRIIESSGCSYLEELITCVHVIQLKTLTCVRVGQKQKKVDIDVPSVDDFIHKVYSNVARKLYTNIYLFEKNLMPLQIQKHNRELELIIKECIMNSVRESIPVETILRAYMDETDEQDIEVNEVVEQIPIVDEESPSTVPINVNEQETHSVQEPIQEPVQEPVQEQVDQSQTRLSFSNIDSTIDTKGVKSTVDAPKTLERLESLASSKPNSLYDDDDEDDEKLKIGENISLDISDINDLNRPLNLLPPPILDDIEILS